MVATWNLKGYRMARPKRDLAPDLSKPQGLTAGLIERLACPAGKQQAFLRDIDTKGLRVRVTAAGAKSYVFEKKLNRQTIRRTIGDVSNWTIDAARVEARRLAAMLDTGTDPREVERLQLLDKAVKQAARLESETYTLAALLHSYCDYLKSLERKSHSAARSIFRVHVIDAWPNVASLPANGVTSEQIADMMRKTIEDGKDRTANKLRSYMRAAYQVAKAARSKPSIPVAFKSFNIKSNPAAETEPDESANRADKNPLSTDEMRAYWQAIKPMAGFAGAALRLHLLTGGQRIDQLIRLLTANVAPDAITLFDGKGRPGKGPRPHTVPLIPAAAAAMLECLPQGEFAISLKGGKSHLGVGTMRTWACLAGAGIKDFEVKRIRSGVETMLAAAGISSDIRGRLQSHGISGVQARHYDGHDYMNEKRRALETMFDVLEGQSATGDNVVMLRAA